MKEKFMDMDTDWEIIKDTQLSFLLESQTRVSVGGDARTAGLEDKNKVPDPNALDSREAMLRNLVGMA